MSGVENIAEIDATSTDGNIVSAATEKKDEFQPNYDHNQEFGIFIKRCHSLYGESWGLRTAVIAYNMFQITSVLFIRAWPTEKTWEKLIDVRCIVLVPVVFAGCGIYGAVRDIKWLVSLALTSHLFSVVTLLLLIPGVAIVDTAFVVSRPGWKSIMIDIVMSGLYASLLVLAIFAVRTHHRFIKHHVQNELQVPLLVEGADTTTTTTTPDDGNAAHVPTKELHWNQGQISFSCGGNFCVSTLRVAVILLDIIGLLLSVYGIVYYFLGFIRWIYWSFPLTAFIFLTICFFCFVLGLFGLFRNKIRLIQVGMVPYILMTAVSVVGCALLIQYIYQKSHYWHPTIPLWYYEVRKASVPTVFPIFMAACSCLAIQAHRCLIKNMPDSGNVVFERAAAFGFSGEE